MAITALRELVESPSEDFGPDDVLTGVEAVHAAPDDADGRPGERTLCGKPTADMERMAYRPDRPEAPWLPPDMTASACRQCADALQPA
ncbi:hypothetical protein AB0M86_29550 [Streptomyces sp. NPDC051639]|uniref:hypothetical protein n=1 Tax=Streptomyces sp. NPDC051639 TaxID=3155671 RepID=UPI0034451E80